MEMILVRHAEPIEAKTADGSPPDPPLSGRGLQQAGALAEWLLREPLDHLISSPALRARTTAEVVAGRCGLAVQLDDRLRDAHAHADRYVPLEMDKLRDPASYRARVEDYQDASRLGAISERVNQALDEWAERCVGERIAVFCHGSVVNVFAARVLGLDTRAFLEADYASAHRFMISRKGVRSVRSLNETPYLPAVEVDPTA